MVVSGVTYSGILWVLHRHINVVLMIGLHVIYRTWNSHHILNARWTYATCWVRGRAWDNIMIERWWHHLGVHLIISTPSNMQSVFCCLWVIQSKSHIHTTSLMAILITWDASCFRFQFHSLKIILDLPHPLFPSFLQKGQYHIVGGLERQLGESYASPCILDMAISSTLGR